MNNNFTFEGIEQREKTIQACLKKYNILSLREAEKICADKNIFPVIAVEGRINMDIFPHSAE